MSQIRRKTLMAMVGLSALGAGGYLQWRRSEVTDPQDASLTDFWARDFDTPSGARLSARAFQGRPLVLNFWATWCPPCVKEMPELDRFSRAAGAQGWQVLGVAIDDVEAVRKFLVTTPVHFPLAIAGTEGLSLVRALGNPAGGLPFTVLISAHGQIQHRKMGPTRLDELQTWAGSR